MTRGFRRALMTTAAGVLLAGALAAPSAAATNNTTGVLLPGQSLDSYDTLVSANGQHTLVVGPVIEDGGALGVLSRTCLGGVIGPKVTADVHLVMQPDGNLVAYSGGAAVWNTGTWGHPGAWASLQSDLNLVVYSPSGQPLWWSGMSCSYANTLPPLAGEFAPKQLRPGWSMQSPDRRYRLVMQTDGNLVLYSPTRALWATGTNSSTPNTMTLDVNGNLRVHNATTTRWQTGTGRPVPFGGDPDVMQLSLQNDGNLVLYRWVGGTPTPVWWSGTAGRG